jgi:hypothetical protein
MGDNRQAWENLAHADRHPDLPGHNSQEAEIDRAGGSKTLQRAAPSGAGASHKEASREETSSDGESAAPINDRVADYVDRHLRVCRHIARTAADEATVCIEIDDYRVGGEYRLVGLTSLWRRMLEAVGFRIAERICLGRKIAISRRGAYMMSDDDQYRRPGYYAPANVTSTLLVAMRGDVQNRLREDGGERETFSKEYAKRHMKTLWHLQPPGEDRMDRTGHPCPQSLRVARAAVRFYSTTGDLVCDPYAGEGTTGVAALEEGRHAALIEPIGPYVETARAKIREITGEDPSRIGGRTSVVVPGAQLRLPMVGADTQDQIRQAAYPGDGSPTERHKEMAEELAEMIEMDVPPSLVSTFLRAERSVVKKRRERRNET